MVLAGHRQAPRQQASPLFLKVHDEIAKSWRAPYTSRLRAYSSSALTLVDGTKDKGYNRLPPLDESVAAHLCPPTDIGWKAKPTHPSKLCRTTSALAERPYSLARQAASTLHSMEVLQVFQAKLLCSMDESNPNPAAFSELHSTTDLALRATKNDSPHDRKIHGHPCGAQAPPVVKLDKDEGCGSSSLARIPDLPHWPNWSCSRGLCWALDSRTKVVPGNLTIPAQVLQLCSRFESPQNGADSAASKSPAASVSANHQAWAPPPKLGQTPPSEAPGSKIVQAFPGQHPEMEVDRMPEERMAVE